MEKIIIQTEFECENCGCKIILDNDEALWKHEHLNMPCSCEETSLLGKDCHPEYFNEVCASCEVQGEVQD